MAGQLLDEGGQAAGGRDRPRPRARLAVARVLVISLSLAGLLVAARGSLVAIWNAWTLLRSAHPTSDSTFQQFESVRRELGVAVPPGSRIYVDPTVEGVWAQRIPEFAYMQDLTVTHDVRQADYVVSISQDPGKTPHVVANRLR